MNTANQFTVARRADEILILGLRTPYNTPSIVRPLTAEEALNLAAWLVAIADSTGGDHGGAFDQILCKILEGK